MLLIADLPTERPSSERTGSRRTDEREVLKTRFSLERLIVAWVPPFCGDYGCRHVRGAVAAMNVDPAGRAPRAAGVSGCWGFGQRAFVF